MSPGSVITLHHLDRHLNTNEKHHLDVHLNTNEKRHQDLHLKNNEKHHLDLHPNTKEKWGNILMAMTIWNQEDLTPSIDQTSIQSSNKIFSWEISKEKNIFHKD